MCFSYSSFVAKVIWHTAHSNFFFSTGSFSCKLAHLPITFPIPFLFFSYSFLIPLIKKTLIQLKINFNIFIQHLNFQLGFLFLVARNCIHKLGMAPGQGGNRKGLSCEGTDLFRHDSGFKGAVCNPVDQLQGFFQVPDFFLLLRCTTLQARGCI